MQSRLLNSLFLNRLVISAFLAILPVILHAQGVDEQYLLGSAYAIRGDYFKAVESYTLAISRNNSDDQLYIKRGIAYLKVKDMEHAIADFNEANLIIPQVADLWLARSYALEQNSDQAVKFLKSHLNSPFRISEDSIKKDPAFDNIQEAAEWDNIWQQNWYDNTEKTISEAAYFLQRRHEDQAVTLLDEEIGRTNDYRLIVARGKAFMQQGNYAAAAGDFSSALNIQKELPEIYAQRGNAYLKIQKFKDAVGDFNKAVKANPGDFGLYLLRAQAYAGQNAWPSALKDMQMYLKYFPDDMKAVYQCGDYYFRSEDYINALKCFNRNLKEDPNNALFYKARGKTYFKTSTYRYATSDLSMALDLDPNDAETWMYYGITLIKSGDRENGCSSLSRARDLGNAEVLHYIIENCN